MCFSATASFIASAALTSTGILAVKKTSNKNHRWITVVPLLFGIQQAIEGTLWISPKGSLLAMIMTYGFLFFAFPFWPIYAPFAVLKVEKEASNRKVMKILWFMGIISGLNLLFFIIKNPPEATVIEGSLKYLIDVPYIKGTVFLYILATVGTLLSSSYRFLMIFGVALLISLSAAFLMYFNTWPSIWCFFSAILSLVLTFSYLYDPKIATEKL
ncbi:hypothetical protein HY605_03030 [Candidatus Peregrinibacteria bacterium]|nr:hypothetical protein [Candidatus Peregrinibacteria bacterium]